MERGLNSDMDASTCQQSPPYSTRASYPLSPGYPSFLQSLSRDPQHPFTEPTKQVAAFCHSGGLMQTRCVKARPLGLPAPFMPQPPAMQVTRKIVEQRNRLAKIPITSVLVPGLVLIQVSGETSKLKMDLQLQEGCLAARPCFCCFAVCEKARSV